MNDHDALLLAIGEHPEEDTPRLMYADWLEENGQPERADFVRNQVEFGRIGLDDPARHALVVKNVHYLNHFVPEWRAQLPQIPGIVWGDFNRGLIEEVQAANEKPIVKRAAEVFAVPGIHILRLRWLDSATKLARVPELTRLRALRLVASSVQADTLRMLLQSPHLGKLNILDLHGNHANDAVAAEIADGRFPELTELWLGNNDIHNQGAMALAHSAHLAKLRTLDLSGNRNINHHATRLALRKRFGAALKM